MDAPLDVALRLVKDVGVPAAIAFFVLWRLDRHLVALTKQVMELHGCIKAVLDELTRRA